MPEADPDVARLKSSADMVMAMEAACQMLYPLSYERTAYKYTAAGRLPVRVDVTRTGLA